MLVHSLFGSAVGKIWPRFALQAQQHSLLSSSLPNQQQGEEDTEVQIPTVVYSKDKQATSTARLLSSKHRGTQVPLPSQ